MAADERANFTVSLSDLVFRFALPSEFDGNPCGCGVVYVTMQFSTKRGWPSEQGD